MSSVNERTVTTVRHEYVVRRPATQKDVRDALHFAARDKAAAGFQVSYDDAIMVDTDDNSIIVYWEEQARDAA
ncbi:hypothetical protein [Arthrobacter sp. A2-55]|uniref:hypothetical protein n=1 Tax=Arthrobacter sp. A2-55 TaxID=2897337 RepID=UPI0021CD4332|nr:hypothetical protein [Arthrobacter sp. A2-55]MCU6480515.1 hypothetical protein [Arthrobacter sp. A2-55]